MRKPRETCSGIASGCWRGAAHYTSRWYPRRGNLCSPACSLRCDVTCCFCLEGLLQESGLAKGWSAAAPFPHSHILAHSCNSGMTWPVGRCWDIEQLLNLADGAGEGKGRGRLLRTPALWRARAVMEQIPQRASGGSLVRGHDCEGQKPGC